MTMQGPSEAVERGRAAGNAAFQAKDWATAIRHYSVALQTLQTEAGCQGGAEAASAQQQAGLLCNRALALYRQGGYAAAASDAEAAALLQDPSSSAKAHYRAALAHLMLGDGAAALPQLQALRSSSGSGSGAGTSQPGWEPAWQQAQAQAAAARYLQQLDQPVEQAGQEGRQQLPQTVLQRVQGLLEQLEEDAEGTAADADPQLLLRQLAAALSSPEGLSDGASFEPACPLPEGSLPTPPAAASGPAAPVAALVLGKHAQLLTFYLTGAYCQDVAAVLRATGLAVGSVVWPAMIWRRLLGAAAGAQGGACAEAALGLLVWAAEQDEWVRTQLLVHPLPALPGVQEAAGREGGLSPLLAVVQLLRDRECLLGLPLAAVSAAAQLLAAFAADAASAEALLAMRCQPLLALLTACQELEQAEGSGHQGTSPEAADPDVTGQAAAEEGPSSAAGATPQEQEQQALEALRQKQLAVFDRERVAARRALLQAALVLARASRRLLLEELVVQPEGSAGGRKTRAAPGALLPVLLALARTLHEESPRRTAPVLGPDGTIRSYIKRPFAADFKDNPAGDFLAELNLDADSGCSSGAAAGSRVEVSGGGRNSLLMQKQSEGPLLTLLELSLHLLLAAAGASATIAALLHRHDVFSLADALCAYATPNVVAAAQELYASVADIVPSAAEELLSGSGDVAAVPALAGLLLHSGSAALQQRAAEKLAGRADGCSGDHFALLVGMAPAAAAPRECAAYRAWQLAMGSIPDAGSAPGAAVGEQLQKDEGERAGLQRAARQLLLRCCERTQRQQQLPTTAAPKGGCWDAIGRQQVVALLRQEQRSHGQQQATPQPGSDGVATLKRGFLGTATSSKQGAAAAAPSGQVQPVTGGDTASREVSSYRQGSVTITELPAEVTAAEPVQPQRPAAAAAPAGGSGPQQRQRATSSSNSAGRGRGSASSSHPGPQEAMAAASSSSSDSDGEGVGLTEVYDSSAGVPPEVRRARANWLASPLADRVHWSQTSSDVSAYFVVPQGTRAAELSVHVTPAALELRLGWLGRLGGGALGGGVKAKEARWCLEDQEVHVLLPKAEAAWWRALFAGGEERSYQDLLQEAVHADEPVKPYEQLDEGARQLLESIQERQAYISAGMIDPEGFDDFRVVIGEASLKVGSSRG